MPKKAAPLTVEQARKRLVHAINRRVIASQERMLSTPETRAKLVRELRLSGVDLLGAIDDFEAAVRRNPHPPLSDAMRERCTFVDTKEV